MLGRGGGGGGGGGGGNWPAGWHARNIWGGLVFVWHYGKDLFCSSGVFFASDDTFLIETTNFQRS